MADLFKFIEETKKDIYQSIESAKETTAHRELIERNKEEINHNLNMNARDQSRESAFFLNQPFDPNISDADFLVGYHEMPEMKRLKCDEKKLISQLDGVNERASNIAEEEYMLMLDTRSKAIIQRENIKQVLDQTADETQINDLQKYYIQVQQEIVELLKECRKLRNDYKSIKYSELEALE